MTTRTPKARGTPLRGMSGFTLIELVMTIAIGATVMTLAVPSFRYVTNSNRIAGEINGLLGDLQFARAEAIKEGRNVTVCVSDGTSCLNSTDWKTTGWIVFSDPANPGVRDPLEAIIRVQGPMSGSDTIASDGISAVSFNREGYASVAGGALITVHTSPTNNAWTRCLSITFVGQMTTEHYNDVANGTPCT